MGFMDELRSMLVQEAIKKGVGKIGQVLDERVLAERDRREELDPRLKAERLKREAEEAKQAAIRRRLEEEARRQEEIKQRKENMGCLGIIALVIGWIWIGIKSEDFLARYFSYDVAENIAQYVPFILIGLTFFCVVIIPEIIQYRKQGNANRRSVKTRVSKVHRKQKVKKNLRRLLDFKPLYLPS